MLVKNMPLPACMLPDGAAPCDEYVAIYERAKVLEMALVDIREKYAPNADLARDIDKALYGEG